MGYYVDPAGNYYERDRASPLDQPYPKRPSPYHDPVGGGWVENLARATVALCAEVDAESGRALLKYPSPGPFRSEEYLRAERQAREFKAAGYTGTVPQSLQSWLDNNTKGYATAQQAADDIIATADFMNGKLDAARDKRLYWKKRIELAGTIAAKLAERDAAFVDLATL